GKGYQHRDKAFKELLEKVDGLRYTPRVTAVKVNYHHYSCQSCGQVYRRRRRVNLRKFACGYCHGRLIESF
ncbi:SprT family protein, partial [Streptococcus agalactiae]|nr:SprT family protein [Streptococcus agalactiae]